MKLQNGLKVIRDLGYQEISYKTFYVRGIEKSLEEKIRIAFYSSNVTNRFQVFGLTLEARETAAKELQDSLEAKGYEISTWQDKSGYFDCVTVDVTNLKELNEVVPKKSRF
jgi:ABC-type lipoprotein release transport system permease subunit